MNIPMKYFKYLTPIDEHTYKPIDEIVTEDIIKELKNLNDSYKKCNDIDLIIFE